MVFYSEEYKTYVVGVSLPKCANDLIKVEINLKYKGLLPPIGLVLTGEKARKYEPGSNLVILSGTEKFLSQAKKILEKNGIIIES